jgi:hypothetical protein
VRKLRVLQKQYSAAANTMRNHPATRFGRIGPDICFTVTRFARGRHGNRSRAISEGWTMTNPGEADLEAPEEDAAEQAMSAFNDDRDEDLGSDVGEQDPEAPEWDVHEQHQVVDLEDDEYR